MQTVEGSTPFVRFSETNAGYHRNDSILLRRRARLPRGVRPDSGSSAALPSAPGSSFPYHGVRLERRATLELGGCAPQLG